MRRYGRAVALLFLPLAAACGAGASSGGASVRDSAGVRIVESTAGRWGDGEAWRLAPSPRIDIGGVPGDPTQELFRVGDAARLADGRIVVADIGSRELRFYDAGGAHLLTAGGRGGGPGEFQSMSWLQMWRDTIVVADRRPPTLSYFDLDGRYARSARLDVNPAGVFADGTVLATQTDYFDEPRDGLLRPPSTVLRYDAAREQVDTLGRITGSEGFMRIDGRAITVLRLPFGRSTVTVVRGETFYVADDDRYQIDVYGMDGALRSSIRKAHQNLPATQADLDTYVDGLLDDAGDSEPRREAARALRTLPLPETFPAFGWNEFGRLAPVLVDDGGHLWVLEYNRPGDEAYRWSVFDPEGRLLGEVAMPDGLEPVQIGDDFVLGRWRDELDVEHVRLYDLIKP